jgi:hemoglobin-like flavoprotein
MDGVRIALVQDNFARVRLHSEDTGRIFAEEMQKFVPQAPGLVDSALAPQDVLDMLEVAFRYLPMPERIETSIGELAERDGKLAIGGDEFSYAGNALLKTLKRSLHDDFSPEAWEAWVEALCLVSGALRNTAKVRSGRVAA